MTLASAGPLRIQICGSLAIEHDGQRVEARLPGRQGRLLFTYLVVNRHRQVSRDELAEALWREPDPAAVDTRLNPLLSKLRRVFDVGAVDGRVTIQLHLPDAWVDLEAAVEAIHRAESAVAQHDWVRAWGPVLVALFVAERDFLPGEDAPWIDEIRHQLTVLRLRALECYAATELSLGGAELAGAVRAGRQLIRLAPCERAAIATSCKRSPRRTTWAKLSTSTASSVTAYSISSVSHLAPRLASSTNGFSPQPEWRSGPGTRAGDVTRPGVLLGKQDTSHDGSPRIGTATSPPDLAGRGC
jgi:DNA-binding SARP family transcriptional activator